MWLMSAPKIFMFSIDPLRRPVQQYRVSDSTLSLRWVNLGTVNWSASCQNSGVRLQWQCANSHTFPGPPRTYEIRTIVFSDSSESLFFVSKRVTEGLQGTEMLKLQSSSEDPLERTLLATSPQTVVFCLVHVPSGFAGASTLHSYRVFFVGQCTQ